MGPGAHDVPDYLLIGHLSRDFVDGTARPGGTVYYAGLAAARLGRRVGIVTAWDTELPRDLREATDAVVTPSAATTFELISTPTGRELGLKTHGVPIPRHIIPAAWMDAQLVHLAPIADEVPVDLLAAFPRATVVVTPQGWLRDWDDDGHVSAVPERLNALPLEGVEAVVLSAEDIAGSTQLLDDLAQRVPIVVLTQGSHGYSLVVRGTSRQFPAAPALERDPTGAGDVFAAAFFARLNETGDPEGSARFAAVTAAISIEAEGASRVPTRAEVEARLKKWQRGEPHG